GEEQESGDRAPVTGEPPLHQVDHYHYRKKQRRYGPEKQQKQTHDLGIIVAAGLMGNGESPSLWRVATLADLGVALRLAAPSGFLDVVPAEGNGERFLRIPLADQPDMVTPTVFY
ncbi:MAG: hypothetical protein WBQ37_13305, partial [Candidatus Competibacter sp.]